MKLKPNMYARTKYGYIAKCIYIDEELESIYGFDSAIRRSFGDEYDFIYCEEQEKYIIKTSHNIIDLIEVGDYVNGERIDSIQDGKLLNSNSWDGWLVDIASCNEDVKSIVTKEQFEQMSYKVGDEK